MLIDSSNSSKLRGIQPTSPYSINHTNTTRKYDGDTKSWQHTVTSSQSHLEKPSEQEQAHLHFTSLKDASKPTVANQITALFRVTVYWQYN